MSIGTIIILGYFRGVSKTDSQLPVMIKCGFRNPSSSLVIIILGCFRWVSKTRSQLPVIIKCGFRVASSSNNHVEDDVEIINFIQMDFVIVRA